MNHMYRALKTSHLEISTTALLRMTLQCLKRNYCSSKALPDTQLSQGQEILLHNMISATDVCDILSSIKLHHGIMNSRHLMEAFRAIFYLQKSDNSNMSNCEVVNNSGFRVLCETLKSNVRSLDSGEVLDALKTLSYLGVSPKSKLIQILLHILAKEINVLTAPQLMFLDFLIKKFENDPITEALKIALPVVIDSSIEQKIDIKNISNLSDVLYYSTKMNLSPSTHIFLIDSLIESKERIDFKTSKLIIRSLCDLRLEYDKIPSLLHHCIDVLIKNIQLCKYQELDLLISRLALRYSLENQYYYHERLIDSSATLFINQFAGFEESVSFLRKILKFGHVSYDLLNYITETCTKKPVIVKDCSSMDLFTLIGGYAHASYRPSNWEIIEGSVLQNALSRMDNVHLPWVKFTRDMCCIGCWPTNIFNKLFSQDFLDKYLERGGSTQSYLQILSLHADISSLCKWYTGPRLPRETFSKAVKMSFDVNRVYPLAKYISKAFENEKVLTMGVMTKQGHFMGNDYIVKQAAGGREVIDSVIIIRSDYPRSSIKLRDSSSYVFLEDLPPGSSKMVLLYLSPSAYTANTQQFTGPTKMMIESLESSGVLVTSISSTTWEVLQEHERVPFIKKIVRARLSCRT